MNKITETIKRSDEEFKMFVPEDDGSASDWHSNSNLALLQAIKEEVANEKYNLKSNSVREIDIHNAALIKVTQLLDEAIKEVDK